MKKPLFAFLIIVLLVFAGLHWIADNLDELVADGIVHYGSTMTQARVGVEHVEIQPSNGKGVISGLLVGNPKGFKTPHALRVERISVEIDMATLAKEVIVVRQIVIDKPDVIYEKGETMTNFDAIQKNIAAYVGPSGKGKPASRPLLVVEELTLCNASASACAPFMGGKTVSIPLPDISLKNIGAAKGGVTPGELGNEIANALKAKLSVAGNFERLKRSTCEALDKAGAAVKGLFK